MVVAAAGTWAAAQRLREPILARLWEVNRAGFHAWVCLARGRTGMPPDQPRHGFRHPQVTMSHNSSDQVKARASRPRSSSAPPTYATALAARGASARGADSASTERGF